MKHFENCRTFGNNYEKQPKDIVIAGIIINIDYAANALYWIDRLNERLTYTATDRNGRNYHIYTNPERNLATAIPVETLA